MKQYFYLTAVLLTAFYFRTVLGLSWDEGSQLHPDERFLTMVTGVLKLPGSWSEYLNSDTSKLSPYNNNYSFFVYGTFPIFLCRYVWALMHDLRIESVGRVLSSIADIATIFMVFVVGRRLFSTAVGLLSATLLALCVQNIQLSHFYGVENFVALFVLITFYFTIVIREHKDPLKQIPYAALTGVFLGLALSSKVSALFFLPIIGISLLEYESISFFQRIIKCDPFWKGWNCWQVFTKITCFFFILGFAFLSFRIFQPYSFKTGKLYALSDQFLKNMAEIKGLMAGADFPPSIQWVDRDPFWFNLYNMLWFQMSPAMFMACFAGIILAIYKVYTRKEDKLFSIILWVLFFFSYQTCQFVKAGRYFSIIYPFLTLLGGYFICEAMKLSEKKSFKINIASIFIVPTLLWAIAFTNIYRKPVSRISASRWMFDNIPCGTVVANETWDDPMPMRVDGKDPFGGCYRGLEFNHYWPDDKKKLNDTLTKLEATSYIILSSNRLFESIPRLPHRFPFTIEYYKMLFDGRLGFNMVHEEHSYPNIFGVEFSTASAEETFTVYDHPTVYIFKKNNLFDINKVTQHFSEYPDGVLEPLVKRG